MFFFVSHANEAKSVKEMMRSAEEEEGGGRGRKGECEAETTGLYKTVTIRAAVRSFYERKCRVRRFLLENVCLSLKGDLCSLRFIYRFIVEC